jgi:hypothetical protein
MDAFVCNVGRATVAGDADHFSMHRQPRLYPFHSHQLKLNSSSQLSTNQISTIPNRAFENMTLLTQL